MGIVLSLFSLVVISCATAAANPPTGDEITAVRIILSTNSFQRMERYTSSVTVEGESRLWEGNDTVTFPTTTLDGYTRRYSFDPDVIDHETSHEDLVRGTRGTFGFEFYPDWAIAEIKYPREALVTSMLDPIFLPIAIVKRIERREGRFDKHDSLGEPFTMLGDESSLLRSKPLFSCEAQYAKKSFWLSYNPAIGRDILKPICDRKTHPSNAEIKIIRKSGRVINVAFPVLE